MEKKCPKCDGSMVPGRRRDEGDSWATGQEKWIEGSPKDEVTGWTTGKGNARRVITFACRACGYLESYLYDKLESESNY